jgi:YVTN family beta-propeller protein
VIKTATNTVTSTIGVETPGRLAVSPDGSRVYVTADNLRQLSVIDTATNLVTATINLGGSPGDIAVSPDGTRGYVITRSTQNSDDIWVAVINTDPDSAGYNSVINRIKVGGTPVGLAVSAGGSEIYVTQSRTRTVSTIEAATNTITATVGVGNFPVGIAAGSRQIYVVNSYEFTPYKAPTLSVVSTVTDSVVATINIAKDAGREIRGKGSTWVAIAPGDGGKIWVTNPLDNLVAVIDSGEYINGMRPTNTVTATIGVGKTPAGVAITPDGRFAYVTNSGDGTVSVISTGTRRNDVP